MRASAHARLAHIIFGLWVACFPVWSATQAGAQNVIDFGHTNGFIDVARNPVSGDTLLPGWEGETPPSSPIQYVLGAHASAGRYDFAASSVDGRYFLIRTPRTPPFVTPEIEPEAEVMEQAL